MNNRHYHAYQTFSGLKARAISLNVGLRGVPPKQAKVCSGCNKTVVTI